MAILLLRLSGPLQSWGSRSRFSERDTEREPTKSGILGLLCAAMGKPRDEQPDDGFPPLAELAQLRLGIRVDCEGVLRRDFQTAGGGDWRGGSYGVRKASGAPGDTVISNRYYLADAVFVAALEGEEPLLARLEKALANPVWPLSLGRKAFVPAEPVRFADCEGRPTGLRSSGTLQEALKSLPWLPRINHQKQPPGEPRYSEKPPNSPKTLRFVLECKVGEEGSARQDVPLSFVSAQRQFTVRRIQEKLIAFEEACKQEADACT